MNDLNEIFSRTALCEGLVIPKKLSFCMPQNKLSHIALTSVFRSGVKEVYTDKENFAISNQSYGKSLPASINPAAALFNGSKSKGNTEVCIALLQRYNVAQKTGSFPKISEHLSTTSDVYVIALSPFSYTISDEFIVLASKTPIPQETIEEVGYGFYIDEEHGGVQKKTPSVSGGIGVISALLMVAFSADVRCRLDENPDKILKISNKEFFHDIAFRHID